MELSRLNKMLVNWRTGVQNWSSIFSKAAAVQTTKDPTASP
jgi:hypothetical protein